MDSNDNINPGGITGLAMIVGQLRAELDRQRDDHQRELNTIRTAFSDFQAERESREVAMLETIETLTDVVTAAKAPAKAPAPTGSKPAATNDVPAPLPTMTPNERPSAYHKRLASWAEANGLEAPPTPPTGPVANSRAYGEKVSRFYDDDAD